MMEYIYQNDGYLLLEVDSYDTSKACHECGMVNEKLKVGEKEWTCPNCGQVLVRDYNASLNIRDWAQDITKHPKHGKTINGSKVKDSDLLLVF
ncbi:zinc ribbon domain-containing protein [Lactobacillus crispatus]|uniref:zinc ribbon domain-containing protein n=1 Tax=Lactobacillus crispatus TaxID=47770 RepID=UPI0018E2E451|nr:zinc ribbon domain-containing protein [Lactobacillus crispatus]